MLVSFMSHRLDIAFDDQNRPVRVVKPDFAGGEAPEDAIFEARLEGARAILTVIIDEGPILPARIAARALVLAFLLSAPRLDGTCQARIAGVLGISEATASRLVKALRAQLQGVTGKRERRAHL